MIRYTIGEPPRANLAFTDATGASIVASDIEFTFKRPDGTTVQAIPETLDGDLFADQVVDQAGRWAIRVTCNLPEAGATEAAFIVLASAVL
jgi:hypothetical protein